MAIEIIWESIVRLYRDTHSLDSVELKLPQEPEPVTDQTETKPQELPPRYPPYRIPIATARSTVSIDSALERHHQHYRHYPKSNHQSIPHFPILADPTHRSLSSPKPLLSCPVATAGTSISVRGSRTGGFAPATHHAVTDHLSVSPTTCKLLDGWYPRSLHRPCVIRDVLAHRHHANPIRRISSANPFPLVDVVASLLARNPRGMAGVRKRPTRLPPVSRFCGVRS